MGPAISPTSGQVLTLTGVGGTGKTRLALQVAALAWSGTRGAWLATATGLVVWLFLHMSRRGLLSFDGWLTRWRGTSRVFDHLDLTIRQHERVAILGPNGSGKTTMLHTILGLLEIETSEYDREMDIAFGP